ncbi:uncharacterized protein LOC143612353 [Bidens hawaiensis]|uniref:uncharacterized protein LOC143612353 n=1 Tax=Bidens hawaiensis TaxID=980011 RepID=UPI00404BA164
MPSPSSLKEVHTLNGRLVALNRFLANHAAKSYPFVSTLWNCLKKAHFKWTPEAEQAFLEVKKCLMELPTLTAPQEGEPLTLYLSASDINIGAVLLTDRKTVQTQIYYVSRTLADAETRYSMLEKLVLALVCGKKAEALLPGTSRHRANRLQDKRRVGKTQTIWEIGQMGNRTRGTLHRVQPRPAIKGQVLADFLTEIPDDKVQECLNEQQPPTPTNESKKWILFTDGASSGEGSGTGLKLVNPDGQEFTYAIMLNFKSTNNEAEYEAFMAGLWIAKKLGVKFLEARVDSMLIASQVSGSYEAKMTQWPRICLKQKTSCNSSLLAKSCT